MKETEHGLSENFLNNFIHIRIMKRRSYEGSHGAEAPEAKGQKLQAGCSSTRPVPPDPRGSGPSDSDKTPKWQLYN